MRNYLLCACIAMMASVTYAQIEKNNSSELKINADGSASYIISGEASKKLFNSMTDVESESVGDCRSGNCFSVKKVSSSMSCSAKSRDRLPTIYECEVNFSNIKAGLLK